ncbi:MAG: hypothetical protein ACP5D2_03470 [Candidatus Nanoarchaeia archaeon]
MAGGLDAFLNFAIPAGIFLFFGFKVYQSVQDPADRFFAWIKQSIFPDEEQYDPTLQYEIIYN